MTWLPPHLPFHLVTATRPHSRPEQRASGTSPVTALIQASPRSQGTRLKSLPGSDHS